MARLHCVTAVYGCGEFPDEIASVVEVWGDVGVWMRVCVGAAATSAESCSAAADAGTGDPNAR